MDPIMSARLRIVVGAGMASLAIAVPAIAGGWNASGTGVAASAANVVSAVANSSVTVTAASPSQLDVKVSTAPASGATPTGYKVMRGANTVCANVQLGATCSDTGLVANTSYTYSVYSLIGSWTSAMAAQQSGITPAATATLSVAITYPVSGGAYSNNSNNNNQWTDAITGTTSGGSGAVAVSVYVKRADGKYWNGSAWVANASDLYLSTSGTAANWSLPFTRKDALNGTGGDTNYTVGAKAVDSSSTKTTTVSFSYTKS